MMFVSQILAQKSEWPDCEMRIYRYLYLVSHTGTPLVTQHQHPLYMWYQLRYHGPCHSTSHFYHIRYNYQAMFSVLVELACWCNTFPNSRYHLSDAIPWLGYRLDIKHE